MKLAVAAVRRRVAEHVLVVQLVGNPPGRADQIVQASRHLRASAAVVGNLAKGSRIDVRVDGARLRRVDRDRVGERVAADQSRADVAQRRGTRRVGTVRDQQNRRPLAVTSRNQWQGSDDRIVRRRAAERPQPVERGADHVGRIRPGGDEARLVVEGEDEELVRRIEQLEEKPVDGGTRILDALAIHAVADVEQHAEADRHALARELRHGLAFAVLEDVERVAVEPRDQAAFGITHGGRHADHLDAGFEQPVVADRGL